MKITTQQIRQIINEELSQVLWEFHLSHINPATGKGPSFYDKVNNVAYTKKNNMWQVFEEENNEVIFMRMADPQEIKKLNRGEVP